MNSLLSISNLYVSVSNKKVLNNIDLDLKQGSTHLLLGPNGSGKSTLAYVLAGHPRYIVNSGSIKLGEQNITENTSDIRAKKGLFVSFQQVPATPGVKVLSFLKEAFCAISGKVVDVMNFRSMVYEYADLLHIDHSLLGRSLYQGFSGGEKKRIEILQLLLLNPHVAILDEIDSGVDVDSRSMIISSLKLLRKRNPTMCMLIITHYHCFFEELLPDEVHIMRSGKIVRSGGIGLMAHVEKKGYKEL